MQHRRTFCAGADRLRHRPVARRPAQPQSAHQPRAAVLPARGSHERFVRLPGRLQAVPYRPPHPPHAGALLP